MVAVQCVTKIAFVIQMFHVSNILRARQESAQSKLEQFMKEGFDNISSGSQTLFDQENFTVGDESRGGYVIVCGHASRARIALALDNAKSDRCVLPKFMEKGGKGSGNSSI